MSSSPRTRTSQTAIFALAVGAAIVGLSLLAGRSRDQRPRRRPGVRQRPLPADRGHDRGRPDPRPVHDRLPDRGGHLHRRRGPDHLDGHPLPAQAGRRHAAAADPRQQHRRARLDDRPDDHRHLHVRDLVADAQPVDTSSADAQTKIRAVAGQFQWTVRLPRRRRRDDPLHADHPAGQRRRRHDRPGRPDRPADADQPTTSSTPSTSRSSCSSATSSRVGSTSSTSRSTKSDVGQTFRGQCAELCGSGPQHHAVRRQGDVRRRLRCLARRARSSRAPSAPPATAEPARAASRAERRSRGRDLTLVAKDIEFEQTALTAPADHAVQRSTSTTRTRRSPHNVAIHQDSPTGEEVFKGEIFPGVAEKAYAVPALQAGPYAFVCTVHPNMTGTLTVQ